MKRLAAEISDCYPQGLLAVAVLPGCIPFVADLARALTVPMEIDFLAISPYAPGSGRVRLTKDLDADIAGRDVVLVEEIVDTGLTLNYVMGQLAGRAPKSLSACTLLDRRRRRIVPVEVQFVGMEIDDDLVVGYGLAAHGVGANRANLCAR